jgi:DNA-binding SARP family transcriptional activator/WD40 repeat protein/tRNA A-37 threonylcarbamoyl transferase component Bud32
MVDTGEVKIRTGVRFTVLRGAVGALQDGDAIALGGPQQRKLLAALLAEHDSVVSADRLVEWIWPEDAAPDGARRTVMSYVSRLRGAIGTDHLVTRDNGYELALAGASYDAADFELLLAEARASDGDAALAAYDRALALWSGRAFGDDADEWWLRPVATRLEELRLVANEERAEQLIVVGRTGEAVADLERLVAEQPLRERFVEQLMRALYLCGRQAEALRSYRRFADYLADETGLPPSDGLVDLEHRITLGDPSLAPSSREALPGYELGDLLGEGAFGAVYRAIQPSVGREVAVKVVRADLADDPRFIQRFEAEAQLVARLEHPHVVPLYDFWRRPGGAYLVFRLLRGGNLADRIAAGPVPLPEVTRFVEELSGALATAHALGVVHRDVKPANVLFDELGNSYLADFGIAVLDGGDETDGDGNSDRVRALDLRSAGSPLYASPEQTRDASSSSASDQYALGVLTWEALTGRAPFSGSTATELLRAKLGAAVPRLPDDVDAPGALGEVLRRATAPHPSDRFPDVSAFAQAWRDAVVAGTMDALRTTGGSGNDRSDGGTAVTLTSLPPIAVNPYKGLRAFREADAADFHGRDRLVERLAATVAEAPFTVVVGPSGSGKSSLVHAGLVPELRRRGALVVSMVPGNEPLVELEAALRRVATEADGSAIGERLQTPGGLLAVAADLSGGAAPLVLVVDQFEELWTLVTVDRARERFAELLVRAAVPQELLRVVVTLRADHYDLPLQHPGLGAVVSGATFAVTPMTAAELTEAIVVPAEQVGVRFEPGLVAAMVGDVVSRPGALPLLQFTLTELFDQRRDGTVPTEAYARVGGIGGALASRAEHLYTDLPPASQPDVRRLFTQLVTPGDDSEDLRRRATVEELGSVDTGVIDAYLASRLLVSDRHPITREPTIEVAHEALLREWPRLRDWIDEDRDAIRFRRGIAVAASEWREQGRDDSALYRGRRLVAAEDVSHWMALPANEQEFLAASRRLADRERAESEARALATGRQNLHLRRLLVAASILVVVALVVGGFALVQRQRASSNAGRATNAQNAALARGLAAKADTMVRTNRGADGLLLAVEAQRFAARTPPTGTAAEEARDDLLRSVTTTPSLAGYLEGAVGTPSTVAYSPDGRYLVSNSNLGGVRVWDAATRRPVAHQPAVPDAGPVQFAVNDTGLLVTRGRTIRVWDLHANRKVGWQPSLGAAAGWNHLALGDDGVLAVSDNPVGTDSSTVELWDLVHHVRLGHPLTVAGSIQAMALSPDGHQLALSTTGANGATLDLELVDVTSATTSVRVVAHRGSSSVGGAFDPYGQPFFAQVVYSPDGRRISSVASRAHDGAIATFDTATGAELTRSSVGADQTVLAIAPDLKELAVQLPGTVKLRQFGTDVVIEPTGGGVLDASDGRQLSSFPLLTHELLVTPVAIDPTRPQLVYPSGLGALAVANWEQFGAPGFASVASPRRLSANAVLAQDGAPVDLTAAIRRLKLTPNENPVNGRSTWVASTSNAGPVAIVTGSRIAIWDPHRDRVVRTLTGVPPGCAGVPPHDVTFAGSARHGRIVLGCAPSLLSWDLAADRSAPAWTRPWVETRSDEPIGPMLTPDGGALMVPDGYRPLELVDPATGRDRVTSETVTIDNLVRMAASPDGRTLALVHWSGDVDLIDTRSGAVRQVLTSPSGLIVECGCGGSPAIGFSRDGAFVALYHGATGLEVWNARTGDEIGRLGGTGLMLAASGTAPDDVEDGITMFTDELAVGFDRNDNTLLVTRATRFTHPADDSGPDGRYQIARTLKWSMRTSDWQRSACRLAGRDLSPNRWNQLVGADVPYDRTCTPMLSARRRG